MNRPGHTYILKLGVMLVALLVPASPALAEEEAPSGPPVLNLSVLGSVRTGEPVQFSGQSAYTSPEQLYLTVSAVPSSSGCPSSSALPSGADPVLKNEPVDNFLSITDLSDNLKSPGQWTLCGYLTNSAKATIAAASVPFSVTGSARGPKGHQSRGKSHKHHKN
jgi:hypothetical protein